MGQLTESGLNIEQRQKFLIEKFKSVGGWEERYKMLIEWGKQLPVFPVEHQIEELKVKGCQSQVWLKAESRGGRVYFLGESDALLVKGLLALVLYVYSDSTPQEILQTSPEFIEAIGFGSHLSPSRANGLVAMIKQIKFYAQAFALLKN